MKRNLSYILWDQVFYNKHIEMIGWAAYLLVMILEVWHFFDVDLIRHFHSNENWMRRTPFFHRHGKSQHRYHLHPLHQYIPFCLSDNSCDGGSKRQAHIKAFWINPRGIWLNNTLHIHEVEMFVIMIFIFIYIVIFPLFIA